jgi:hypothetical protein
MSGSELAPAVLGLDPAVPVGALLDYEVGLAALADRKLRVIEEPTAQASVLFKALLDGYVKDRALAARNERCVSDRVSDAGAHEPSVSQVRRGGVLDAMVAEVEISESGLP